MPGYKKVTTTGEIWDFEKSPILEGIYMSVETNVGVNKSNLYSFHDQNEEAKIFKIWGSTALDAQMQNVSVGQLTKITYLGKFPSPKRPGKEFRKYDLEV